MNNTNLTLLYTLLTIIVVAYSDSACSQSKSTSTQTISFLDTKIFPMKGTYVVLKDANVRNQPATKGRKVSRRSRGDRVRVVGRAKGHWLAIRGRDGKDIGFIYRSILMPLIDGTLKNQLNGKLNLPNARNCDYIVRFDGKTPAEGQFFEFADYLIKWECRLKNGLFAFNTPMFLTEGPYRGNSKRIHQITIDILGLAESMENVFSTHVLWDRENAQVTFDSITLKEFSRVPSVKKLNARNMSEALHGTIKIAASAWNGPLWKTIIKRQAIKEN